VRTGCLLILRGTKSLGFFLPPLGGFFFVFCYQKMSIHGLSAYIKGGEALGIFKILKLRSTYIHRVIFEAVDVEPAGSRGNEVTGRTAAQANGAR
jgi:hypothetical protein